MPSKRTPDEMGVPVAAEVRRLRPLKEVTERSEEVVRNVRTRSKANTVSVNEPIPENTPASAEVDQALLAVSAVMMAVP
jgi:predicted component of type VI protein secretion system